MKTHAYKITLIFLVFLLISSAAIAQKNLLLINSEAGNPADTLLIAFLDLEGWTTTFLLSSDFGDAEWAEASAYEDYDAVFIGEKLGSGSVYNFHAAGYPLPCVNTEGWAYKESAGSKWGWITDEASQFHQLGGADNPTLEEANTLVFLGDETTWLGRQYEEDESFFWTTSETVVVGSNGIAMNEFIDEAVAIANMPATVLEGKPVMWAIPEGTTVTTDPNTTPVDITLEHPMVYLGCIDEGQASPSEEFHTLILNCLKWVTGDYEVINSINNLQHNNLQAWPNPTNGIVNVSLKLPVSGNVTINIYNMTGTLIETIDSHYVTAGLNTLHFDLSDKAAAQYIFEIITEENILRGKIFKN